MGESMNQTMNYGGHTNVSLTVGSSVNLPLIGWECPKCGGVYAPFVPSCSNCSPNHKHESLEYDGNWLKQNTEHDDKNSY